MLPDTRLGLPAPSERLSIAAQHLRVWLCADSGIFAEPTLRRSVNMLITFKSRASGDVIMFGEVARLMLVIIGKDPMDERGIITVAQLPGALAALGAAIARDKAERASHEENQRDEEEHEEAGHRKDTRISFSQRAVPLVELMAYSMQEQTPVIWETSMVGNGAR